MTKDDLASLPRTELVDMAGRLLEIEERIALSRVEQNKPADEQTVVTCLFCDLVVGDGLQAVAAQSGAVICADCIARANATLLGRPDLSIAIRADPTVKFPIVPAPAACTVACPEYPLCRCGV